MAGTRGARGLVALLLVAGSMDLVMARSLQQGTAKPGTGAAAALAVPVTGPGDADACVGPTKPGIFRFMWWVHALDGATQDMHSALSKAAMADECNPPVQWSSQ
jgi:hypothetical protein